MCSHTENWLVSDKLSVIAISLSTKATKLLAAASKSLLPRFSVKDTMIKTTSSYIQQKLLLKYAACLFVCNNTANNLNAYLQRFLFTIIFPYISTFRATIATKYEDQSEEIRRRNMMNLPLYKMMFAEGSGCATSRVVWFGSMLAAVCVARIRIWLLRTNWLVVALSVAVTSSPVSWFEHACFMSVYFLFLFY